MKKKKNNIGEKIVKKLLTIAVIERSFNFDNIEMRIIESKKRVESISLGNIGKKPCLSLTEQQLYDLYESIEQYFKITGRRKWES